MIEFRCYLCNTTQFRARPGAVRDDPSLTILECAVCGLVSLSSFDHVTAGHYEESGMHGESLISIESWLRITEEDDQRRFELLKSMLVNRRVLDFGCGAAGFVRRAQELASRVTGVEPERRVREHWGNALPICAALDDIDGQFDLITAFHVVEHLADPRTVLQSLVGRLAHRGRLVVEVPNADDALLTLYENDAFRRFTYWSQHLFLFNVTTLRLLAEQAGLKVVAISQFQRYPLSNHLHWLSRGQPGGHQRWSFLDTGALAGAYAAALAAIGGCDTLIAHLETA